MLSLAPTSATHAIYCTTHTHTRSRVHISCNGRNSPSLLTHFGFSPSRAPKRPFRDLSAPFLMSIRPSTTSAINHPPPLFSLFLLKCKGEREKGNESTLSSWKLNERFVRSVACPRPLGSPGPGVGNGRVGAAAAACRCRSQLMGCDAKDTHVFGWGMGGAGIFEK